MAILAKKSSTPTSNPNSRPNLNPRNSENSPMRRSFTGNPFQRPSIHTNSRSFIPTTPANSPAEFSNRNCLGREEKENETAKARSPAVVKGSNHFMIPTISAASKINPSPRKKVLADRNEPIRTSLSFSSDGKSTFCPTKLSDNTEDFDQKSDMGFNSKADRHEHIRTTSFSFSDEKSMLYPTNLSDNAEDFDQKSDKGLNSKDTEIKYYETPSKPDLSQKPPSHIPFLTPTNFPKSSDVKKVTFASTEDFASSISQSIATLDADPSLPPYDPKTNYLSPRPQFLHYKPNPRLELYSSGTKNLEESFLSESLSETEVSEESEPDNSQEESENTSPVKVINEISKTENEEASEVAVIKNSHKESEDVSLSEEAEFKVSEAEPISIPTPVSKDTIGEHREVKVIKNPTKESENASPVKDNNEISEKETEDASEVGVIKNSQKESEDASSTEEAEVKVSEAEPISIPKATIEEHRVIKSHYFTRGKFVSLILVFSIAYLSVSFSDFPVLESPVYENLSRSKFYEEGFNDLARNLKQWSVRSTSYVNELFSGFSGGNRLGPLQFSNLTYMLEDRFNDDKKFKEIYEQDEEEPEFKDEDKLESSLDQNLEKGDQNLENELDSEKKSSCLGAESQIAKRDNHLISDSETTAVPSSENTFKIEASTSVLEVQSSEQSDVAYNSEISETVVIEGDDHLVSDSEIESTTSVPSLGNTFEIDNSKVDSKHNPEILDNWETKGDGPLISGSKTEHTMEMAMDDAYTLDLMPEYKSPKQYKTLAMPLLTLALLSAIFVIYLKNKWLNTHNSTVLIDPMLTNKAVKLENQSYSPEVDLIGDLCSSEMSSFDKSYSYSKRGNRGTNEAQRQDRKQNRVLKRESLASSIDFSMTQSPSYGSTYEILPNKHGYGDEQVVTPVRRSSRIKKIQVTPK